MEKEEFEKLKVGDYVWVKDLNNLDQSLGFNDTMARASNQLILVDALYLGDCYSHGGYIKTNLDSWDFAWYRSLLDRKATEEEVKAYKEKIDKYRYEAESTSLELSPFDVIKIKDAEHLLGIYRHLHADKMAFANFELVVSKVNPETKTFYADGWGCPFNYGDVAEIVSKFDWEKLELMPNEVDMAEIELTNTEDIRKIAFVSITNDVKKIVDCCNSIKFAKAIAGKFIAVDTETNRIKGSMCQNIYKALCDFGCSTWRIDGLDQLTTDKLEPMFKDSTKEYMKLKVDYANKKVEIVHNENGCENCGRTISAWNERKGHYCQQCLEKYWERFCYHDYYGGYKVYENVNTHNVPVFGCEIERDYEETSSNYERLPIWDEDERYEYINDFDEDDAWGDLDLDQETYESDPDYWDERIRERCDEIRDNRAEEYDEEHYYSDGDEYDEDFDYNLSHAMEESIYALQGDQIEKGTMRRENVFMRDGSLNNDGIEWITFPHTFKWYVANKSKIQKALDIMQSYGFGESSATGNHIHINRDYFTINGVDYSDYCASKIAVLFNKYWDDFCAIARREDTYYTSKPSQRATDTPYEIMEKTASNKDNHYVAVNVEHSHTVEIRLWTGIESANELIFFLDNMQALARYAKMTSLEKVQIAKMSDYMKYYKLDSSFAEAKNRICDHEIIEEIDKIIEKRNKKKAGK